MRWFQAMTVYFKKPVNWNATKQYPSVLIFPTEGEGKTQHHTMHVCTHMHTYTHL